MIFPKKKRRKTLKELQAEFGIIAPQVRTTTCANKAQNFNEWAEHNYTKNKNGNDIH